MNRSFALLAAAAFGLSLAAVACAPHVDSGPGSNHQGVHQGEGGSSSSGSDSCGVAPGGSYDAIAISLGQIEAYEQSQDEGSGSSVSTGTGGGGPDPSTIVLNVTNASYTCEAPALSWDCSQGTAWEVSVELAPSQLAPGTFDLSDPSLNAFFSVSGSNGGGDCWGGGGSFLEGELVIDQVDDTAVHFHLVGTNGNDSLDGLDSDGAYVAARCN
ncbi:MAG TPA: hypothetical protein VHB21_12060 [Minicystis sp.]|nr:hypothetical protein [Minicystis sp.]